MSLVLTIIQKIMFRKDPIQYCRKQGVRIGINCSIQGTVSPFGTEPYLVTIGDHVRINDGVQFITHDGSVWVLRNLLYLSTEHDLSDIDLFGCITVGNNVQIGSNAMIMPGVSVGSNVIIGAGSIVTKDVPDNSVVAGIPAKIIESVETYYYKHKDQFDHTKGFSAEDKKAFLLNKYRVHEH